MYRKEIDGLRALAVVLVLLFHLEVALFRGGFVGVDVFYVISGYLITRNIMKDGAAFKLTDFFVRRIRRLMPAVWVTVAVTMVFVLLLMTTEDARKVAFSAVAALFSVSNFTFWSESGYWDTSAAMKPLLHTWSLAVEEQFYLLWPLLLLVLRPLFGGWRLTAVFVALMIAGTALSQWMVRTDPSAAFYLMPFRIMEFAAGAAISAGEKHVRLAFPALVRIAACVGGIALIVWSALSYSGETPFPGVAAMVPALGTALVIASGSHLLSRIVLENPLSTYLGRISYSLYLTHWPIVSLYKYVTLNNLDWRTQLILAAAMLVSGVVLHHTVEKPFRYGQKVHALYPFALGGVLALALLGAAIAKPAWDAASQRTLAGVGWRAALAITMQEAQAERRTNVDACRFETPCGEIAPGQFNIIVLGDSHAVDGLNAVRMAYPDAHIILASMPGCDIYVLQPLAPGEAASPCRTLINTFYGDRERLEGANLLVFSNLTERPYIRLLERSLIAIADIDTPIIVLGNGPVFSEALPDIVRARHLTPNDVIPSEFMDRRRHPLTLDRDIRAVAERYGARFVPMADFFCPDGRCTAWTPDRTRLITYDNHHLSLAAAQAYGRARADVIREAARAP